jgi:prepilin-type N-terminal cleavage/methylation domain-containing protein
MANRRPFYRHGFTIVELLVAVVVIAVLASITVVAYNNVQQRAYSAKVISAVDTYTKALKMYHIQNGRFPDYGPT